MRFKEFLLEKHVGPTSKIGITFYCSISPESQLYDSSEDASYENTVKKAAASLSSALGEEVKVASKVGARSKSKWQIQPRVGDSSWSHAIQIVAPLDVESATMRNISIVAKWMDFNNIKTSDSDIALCAVGLKDIGEKLDPVKLVFFMDTPGAANAFANANRSYTPAQIEALIHRVKSTGRLPSSESSMIKMAERYLGKRSEGQTNFQNITDGVIEFKVAGGAGYEHDIDAIKRKIHKLSMAVEIASDPANSKSEYVRKLVVFFNPDGDQVLPVTKDDAKKLPSSLKRLYRFDPNVMGAWKQYSAEAEHGAPRTQLLVLMNTAIKACRAQHTSLTADEKSFFKRLIRETSLQSHDVDEYYDHDHISRLKFKTTFGV